MGDTLIDPSTFDLIIVGTGLSCSVIAAAASNVGKSVLHLDHNPFYGSRFASLHLDEVVSFLQSQGAVSSNQPTQLPKSEDFTVADIDYRPVYSHVEISSSVPELHEKSRNFNIDLSGPRVLLCAESTVDVIRDSGVDKYLNFKSINWSFIGDVNGYFWSVPDSRAAIFTDKSLSLTEKNQLMRVFKRILEHVSSSEDGTNSNSSSSSSSTAANPRISEHDLDSPFSVFLEKMRLPHKLKLAVLHSIAMVDYDQECVQKCGVEDRMTTREGINRLALYSLSVGKFENASSAFLYPVCGYGELPQAFCRMAAVNGSVYVLRMPVVGLLLDKGSGNCRGVKLGSGQDVFSQNVVLDRSYSAISGKKKAPGPVDSSSSRLKFARAICVSRQSVRPGSPVSLLVFPPRSLCPDQDTAVRALQVDSTLGSCPPGMFVLYVSCRCVDVTVGKRILREASNALFSSIPSEDSESLKPTPIWSATYIEESPVEITSSIPLVHFTREEEWNFNCDGAVRDAQELFSRIFPDEPFLRGRSTPGDVTDEDPV